MLRRAGSRYEGGRSATLLKVKSFHDAEARVLKHQEGAGRHKGRLGALLVEMADGTTFSVGTGFSDAEREDPPPVGSLITFRYQELSEGGVPRFPSYVGVQEESQPSPAPKKGEDGHDNHDCHQHARHTEHPAVRVLRRATPTSSGRSRSTGAEVTVRYGRIGTQGQTNTKSFPDEAAAARHAEKLIQEKTGKGYREVT